MSQRNGKSKCSESKEGASMCTSAQHIMSKVRYTAYLHSLITHLGPDMRDICNGLNM